MTSPRPRVATLTARLVLTAVALVVVVAVLIAVTTTFAVRAYLLGQLDADLRASLDRARTFEAGEGPGGAGGPGGPGGPEGPDGRGGGPIGQAVGTLRAQWLPATGFAESVSGVLIVQRDQGAARERTLGPAALAPLADVPADGEAHDVELGSYGEYRVILAQTDRGTLVSGLPTGDVRGVVLALAASEAVLIALGGGVAVAAGVVLVRRALRPLQQVARTAQQVSEIPLAHGDVDLAARVPRHLTDARTEVGQVGAALNGLLSHVGTALAARERSEQQVRRFVADASHELRTPLSTIVGYTELARRHDDQTTTRMALAKVEEESARMTTLVEDLLLLARLDNGRPLESTPVDLVRLGVEAVSDARVVAPGHHWQLDLPATSVEALGDEQRLHQVLTNLLTNARKYTPAGTVVTVRVDPAGFAVHDTGPGFPPGLGDEAFDRFVRADAGRHREGGAGLGLALVRAIVEAHGGRVTLTSRPGDTTVRIDLRT